MNGFTNQCIVNSRQNQMLVLFLEVPNEEGTEGVAGHGNDALHRRAIFRHRARRGFLRRRRPHRAFGFDKAKRARTHDRNRTVRHSGEPANHAVRPWCAWRYIPIGQATFRVVIDAAKPNYRYILNVTARTFSVYS